MNPNDEREYTDYDMPQIEEYGDEDREYTHPEEYVNTEDYDDMTDPPISIERAKHHCGRLAVDCQWRAFEVEQHIDAQAKEIERLHGRINELEQIIDTIKTHTEIAVGGLRTVLDRSQQQNAVLQAEVRAWRDADVRHDLTRLVMGDGNNDEVLKAMQATDAAMALKQS